MASSQTCSNGHGSTCECDRRRQPRHTLTGLVEVYVVSRDGRFLGWGSLRDVSESGACVHMNVRVLAGEVVELTSSRGKMVAICRHSSSAYSGYLMGFEFLDSSDLASGHDWSPLPATW